MKKNDIVKQVLKKYKFDHELSPEEEKHLFKIRKKILKSVLKRHGVYSMYVSLAVSLFLGIKRFGMSLSIGKSFIAVGSAALIMGAGIAAGAAVAVKKIVIDQPVAEERVPVPVPVPVPVTVPVTEKEKKPAPAVIKKITFKSLYQKYGHVEKVHLVNGNVLKGSFLDKGTKSLLITPGGVVRIQKSEIKFMENIPFEKL
ncbi:MAG: hypothetical protein GY754_15445 [bacterium]|nr:hypothetical protein [bacterium]